MSAGRFCVNDLVNVVPVCWPSVSVCVNCDQPPSVSFAAAAAAALFSVYAGLVPIALSVSSAAVRLPACWLLSEGCKIMHADVAGGSSACGALPREIGRLMLGRSTAAEMSLLMT